MQRAGHLPTVVFSDTLRKALLEFCGERERQTTKFDNLCLPSRLNLLLLLFENLVQNAKTKLEIIFSQLLLSFLPSSFLKVPTSLIKNGRRKITDLWIMYKTWILFFKWNSCLFVKAGMVGAVGKISAFRAQGPRFDPRLCRDLNWFVWLSFPPKLTQLSILPG